MHKNQCVVQHTGCHNVPREMPFYSTVNIKPHRILDLYFSCLKQHEQGKTVKYLLGNGPGSLNEQQRNEIHNTVIITPPWKKKPLLTAHMYVYKARGEVEAYMWSHDRTKSTHHTTWLPVYSLQFIHS